MKEKYLPIGSVVKLKGANKKLMIIGYLPMAKDERIFDYNSCLYPEGLVNKDEMIAFNHDKIEKVDHLGLENEEYEKINNSIKTIVDGIKKVKKINVSEDNVNNSNSTLNEAETLKIDS